MEPQEITNKLVKAQDILNKAFAYVDDGSFFRNPLKWVYKAIGILGVICQIIVFYKIYENTSYLLGEVGQYFFYFLVIVAFVVEVCLTLIYWWKRSKNVTLTSEEGDEIFVLPIVAHIVQCCGEISGIRLVIVGVVFFFFPFFSHSSSGFFQHYILEPICLLVIFCVAAYLTIVIFRAIAESIKARAITANAAKKITRQLENK